MIILMCFTFMYNAFSQTKMDDLARSHFEETTQNPKFNKEDFSEWKVNKITPSLNPEIQHVYIQQYANGIPIKGATYKLTVKNEKVIWHYNQFVNDINKKIKLTSAALSPESAINKNAQYHQLKTPVLKHKKTLGEKISFNNTGISSTPLKAKLNYIPYKNELRLVWSISLNEKTGKHSWKDDVDAVTGEVLKSKDLILSCSWGGEKNIANEKPKNHPKKNDYVKKLNTKLKLITNSNFNSGYRVYAMPLESPLFGAQSIVSNHHSPLASQYGWHSVNNPNGHEFTITRGNNVLAQDDSAAVNPYTPNGTAPTGTLYNNGTLNFYFQYNNSLSPTSPQNKKAAITNLFYWVNIAHDVSYHYGFDEASGNFQHNNFDRNGDTNSPLPDPIFADAQDTGDQNSIGRFSPTDDGESPRLTMFANSNLIDNRDTSLANLIIAHEYAHGISTRLVNGGIDATDYPGADNNEENMNEGWSDWFGLMLTINPDAENPRTRTIGNYVSNQDEDATSNEFRPTPYSTDMNINGLTYANINSSMTSHQVGFIWATILWDLSWALIDAEGYDSDLYTGTGGNNKAMALIIEGIKNTPRIMGFVSGRDAILQADQDLYNGQFECLIKEVFRRRGVGSRAEESPDSLGGQRPSFDASCEVEECSNTITPNYSEGFETSMGFWTQSSLDDLDWVRNSGSTPTSGTGPDGGSDSSNFYMYTLATNSGFGNSLKSAILNSPCIDLTGITNANFSFDYHMENPGGRGGELLLEVSNNAGLSWSNLWGEINSTGNNWITVNIDLIDYVGDEIQLRFKRLNATNETADVAIDNINLNQTQDEDCSQAYVKITSNTPLDCEVLGSDFEFQICGTYCESENSGQSLQNLEVIILDADNNTEISSIPANEIDFFLNSNGEYSYCATITESNFTNGLIGNYNFKALASFYTQGTNEVFELADMAEGISFENCQIECPPFIDVTIEDNRILKWQTEEEVEEYTFVFAENRECVSTEEFEFYYTVSLSNNYYDLGPLIKKFNGICMQYKIISECGAETPWCNIFSNGEEWVFLDGNCLNQQRIAKNNITVFPNPVKAASTFRIKGLEAYDVISIEVNDLFGNIKYRHKLKSDTIRLGNLNTGIYFISISTKQGIIQKKIIVE